MLKTTTYSLHFPAAKAWAKLFVLLLCLLAGPASAWAGYLPTPVHQGTLASGYKARKIISISLNGATTERQTITCDEDNSYFDKSSEHFIIRAGETATATFAWSGNWMHGYIYVDEDKDGTFEVSEVSQGNGNNKTTTISGEIKAYSAYQLDGSYKNSAGTVVAENPGLNPPTFVAPATAGVYPMRYKTDWNSIAPAGGNEFQSAGGVAVDVQLWVVKEYTLVVENAHSGASVTIDGATEVSYTTSGTVLSTNATLILGNIHATDTRGGTPQVRISGTTITVTFEQYVVPVIPISSLNEITDLAGNYILTADVDASSASIIANFRGTLDGDFHKVTGLTHAIFGTLNNATVKNLIIDNVNIASGTDVGAIANTASGNTRIYNCGVLATNGSSISGSGNVGSIAGSLTGNARVINCFSYANVSGGTNAAGIVGNNNGTTANRTTILTGTGSMVMNCMFFGTVSGTSKYPIYGGTAINNVSNINTYNYYIYNDGITYANNATGASGVVDESLLTRFDMYRGILNSHRDLCAMYVNNSQTITQDQKNDMAIWSFDYTKKATIRYLQLEKCVPNSRRTLDRAIPSGSAAYKGKQVGSVSCTFVINGSSRTVSLPITDMNLDNWDYTWGKIVLPFANEFTGWTMPASGSTAYDNAITGWEITSVTGGTAGSWDGTYDMCNPDCTAKDLYANNNYVWAQGGNYVVPTGVTAITFTAHIVRCVYLADSYVDIAYNDSYTTATYLGTQLTNDKYNGKTVYHNLTNAYAQLQDKTNPADQAIVLVGNYHYNQAISADGITAAAGTTSYAAKAATIMSIDADNNQVPDYAFPQFHNVGSGRSSVPPLRFDFVCSPGLGISSYTRAGYLADVNILHSKGWFEVTETAMMHMTEFEMRPQNYTVSSPLILNGGIYDQILQSSTNEYNNDGNNNNLSYIRIGGKAYVKEFWPGHKNSSAMTLYGKPINISGGQIDQCYLTSDPHGKAINGDVNVYCNGGYLKEYVAAYQERITGNVTTKMDHVLVDAFYGGGLDNAYGATAQIAGNISNTINNSYVGFYCAGPKFGTMAVGKTVTTTARGTTFGEYYGAGYGGTALTKVSPGGNSPTYGTGDYPFNIEWTRFTNSRLQYNSSYGTGVGYVFLFNMYAGGNHRGNCDMYVQYATLSLASTNNVSSTLTDCTIENNFYGGGCQGYVNGTITNVLTNCDVQGSLFGGGYKASATPIDVYPTTQPTYSVFKGAEGFFTPFGTTTPETYSWVSGTDGAVDNTNKTIGTSVDMTQMGRVTGAITTTITGGRVGANVFGGGNESPSGNNTSVSINGSAQVIGDVYGGGALANVAGNATVDLLGGAVGSVYGGGLGAKNGMNGATADVAAMVNGDATVTLDGAVVNGNIFGGNNLNGTPEGHIFVNIKATRTKGAPYHVDAVYGGGNLAAYVPSAATFAANKGYTEVLIENCDNSIDYVYGGGNAAPVPATEVTIYGANAINYAFAGGNGAGAGNPGADIGYNGYYSRTSTSTPTYGSGETHITVYGGTVHNVFGGSNTLGFIRAHAYTSVLELPNDYTGEHCELNVGEVYGAGNEAVMYCPSTMELACAEGADAVYGGAKQVEYNSDVNLTITSGTYGKVFGGNNMSGNVKGSITINIDETGCFPILIGELYGGGNEAAYSVFGYNNDGTLKTSGTREYADPVINIRSFTEIGKIFGGGLGETATMYASPTINLNPIKGVFAGQNTTPHYVLGSGTRVLNSEPLAIPDAVGTIGTIYGGGNQGAVQGNTQVNIGTTGQAAHITGDDQSTSQDVEVMITGNVFGGGREATVTGNTQVTIGK